MILGIEYKSFNLLTETETKTEQKTEKKPKENKTIYFAHAHYFLKLKIWFFLALLILFLSKLCVFFLLPKF
jgi:hypothetical protein